MAVVCLRAQGNHLLMYGCYEAIESYRLSVD